MENLIKILYIIHAYQSLMLGFLLLNKKKNRMANNMLSAIFISFGLHSSMLLFFFYGQVLAMYVFPFIFYPTSFILGPLIYFYTLSMNGKIENKGVRTHIHLLPSVISLLLYLITAFHRHATGKISLIGLTLLDYYTQFSALLLGFAILAPLSLLLYAIAGWFALYPYVKDVRNNYADITGIRVIWLMVFLFFVTTVTLGNITGTFYRINGNTNNVISMLTVGLNLTLLIVATFFLLRRGDIFTHTHEALLQITTSKKYQKTDIDAETKDGYEKALSLYMREHKPYLDEGLTLKKLADQLSIPHYHLSIVINERFEQNFFNFINTFRVNEVIEELKQDHENRKNILTLALDSGFNSKTSFNSMFKKVTGKTPSEFRKTLHS